MGFLIHHAATTTASRPICSYFAGTGHAFWNISRIHSRRFETIRANTAANLRMNKLLSLHETYDQIIREQEPNFLRLYLNPHVARTCFCLDRYMHSTWAGPPS